MCCVYMCGRDREFAAVSTLRARARFIDQRGEWIVFELGAATTTLDTSGNVDFNNFTMPAVPP